MINIRRKEHFTMPCVENYYMNDTILKEPPKEVYSLKEDKVNDGGEITQWFGSDEYRDKLSEYITKYDKSSNPAVSVNYSFSTYKNDPRSGFQKSPYIINREGSVRDPILTYIEKYNLGQTYNNYDDIRVMSEPNYSKYIESLSCDKKINMNKKIKQQKNINIQISDNTNRNLNDIKPNNIELKENLDIKAYTNESKNVHFKNPYQNCITPDSIYDKYIVDKAEAIVNTKLKTYFDNTKYEFNTDKFINDENNIFVNTNKSGRKNDDNKYFILDDTYLNDELNVVAHTNLKGNHNKSTEINIDPKLKDIVDAVMYTQQSKQKNSRDNINHMNLQLRDIIDAVAYTKENKQKNVREDVYITREFKENMPETSYVPNLTYAKKVNSDKIYEFDLKDKIHDVSMKHSSNFIPRYERQDVNINIRNNDKPNMYNSNF
jgi:hypothetical protein